MESNFKFIYKEDQPRFIQIFKKFKEGIHKIHKYCTIEISPLPEPPNTRSAKEIAEKWDEVKWFKLYMERTRIKYSNGWRTHGRLFQKATTLAEIKTPAGIFYMMRNGNDIGNQNYAIFRTDTIHLRRNIAGSLLLIDILGSERKMLPLLVGTDFSKKDYFLFEKRLKNDI